MHENNRYIKRRWGIFFLSLLIIMALIMINAWNKDVNIRNKNPNLYSLIWISIAYYAITANLEAIKKLLKILIIGKIVMGLVILLLNNDSEIFNYLKNSKFEILVGISISLLVEYLLYKYTSNEIKKELLIEYQKLNDIQHEMHYQEPSINKFQQINNSIPIFIITIFLVIIAGVIMNEKNENSNNKKTTEQKIKQFQYNDLTIDVKNCELCVDDLCMKDDSIARINISDNKKISMVFNRNENSIEYFGYQCILNDNKFANCNYSNEGENIFSEIELNLNRPNLIYKIKNINKETLSVINGVYKCEAN